ncbi:MULTISPECIES: IclR family transcriptional regulator [unclassified Streptomyces]|uniref:IclR family transcriptional regulator n=1 Tax=unclassified Streptomyces TaxID=2593676 RepID=UPI0038209FCC
MRNTPPDDSDVPGGHGLTSVDNALRVLLMFQEAPEVRVADVARRLGVARSTAHRLLATLCGRGIAVQDGRTRAYRPGRALTDLAHALTRRPDLVGLLRPRLTALCAELGETTSAQVFQGPDVVFADGVEADRTLRVGLRTGARMPAYAVSGGKACLAELTPEEVRALYPRGLVRLTGRTPGDFEVLERELAEVRDRGYAVNLEGTETGLHAVGVAVHDATGRPVAALAVSAPAQRLDAGRRREVGEALIAAARAVEEQLGASR